MISTRNYMPLLLGFTVLFAGCSGCSSTRETEGSKLLDAESSIDINRPIAQLESDRIDAYVARQNWDVIKTGTGLRYYVYEQGTGRQGAEGLVASVNYTVSLLSGKQCYTNTGEEPRQFLIGMDHVESGLHEVICLLHEGDKAKVILPPHLAFGMTGDQKEIPPHASVVYDLEVVSLQ